jgi:hypothetical protein
MGLSGKVAVTVRPVMTENESAARPIASSAADAKELAKIELNASGAISKISSDSSFKFMSLRSRSLCLRQVHNDPQRLIGRELSRPSDDEFLCILVEILFAERKGSRL